MICEYLQKFRLKQACLIPAVGEANATGHAQHQLLRKKISIPSLTVPTSVTLDPNTKLLADWDFKQAEN